ncbi:eukaryotic-like serine/threonine-protein kinase [Methylomarinovum tepidoasis]|uniref:Eukaryotic-like serine/threonine-protein kinase n=1 Tax=Methylomarinovum tepidoasis TaxID=2840183 RepID=A0AAU9C6N5_9GAMM|nr:bifunctional protein-serine/threonine kinase/phosphatase [Methylomarinovum sp. IN45]BCX88050.1 eukaryotic-like serine/threonine-protein kinase [Methylomarinovum sp. IN45]
MNGYQIQIGQFSSAGRKSENQDSFGVLIPEGQTLTYKGIVAAVADGVSACDDPKLASECCIKSLLSDYYCTPESWSVRTSVEKVLAATNRWLYGQGGEDHVLASTLSALVLKSTSIHLFHVGDSRIYRLRRGVLERLTQDHLWGGKRHSQLARALGIDLNLDIDHRVLAAKEGDTYLFTTDGVHDYLQEVALLTTLKEEHDPEAAARRIVEQALASGSTDNLTCQILRIDALPKADVAEYHRHLTELPFPPLLAPGMKLDGYRIVRELNASKRVQVYLALDEASGEKVVLKTPSPNFDDDPLYIDLFSHEEWVGSRIDNPYVMQVLRPDRIRSCLYLVCEYIEGQTLRQWLEAHPKPSLRLVRDLISQITRGLTAFHRLEMVHQDLKPDNILIDDHGRIRLIDFGSVRIAGVEEIVSPIERINLLGTRHYAAPEYFLGYAGTPRSDQFSLAVIAYELLTGHLPYGDKYGEGSVTRLRYTSARRWNPDIPLWLDKALEKALSVDPQRRYETLSEFVHDLEHPNPRFLQKTRQPLIERDPLGFWRALALISLGINVGLLLIFLLS